MTREELIARIKNLVPAAYASVQKAENTAVEYDELTKFPELKTAIIRLLSSDYAKFIDSIDWVAPKPTTFRINLLNGQSFYLIYTDRTWIAEVEGKRYYLLNLPEEQRAVEKIARLLRYGVASDEIKTGADVDGAEDIETETETEEEA